MVVDNFNIVCVPVAPDKTKSPLVVDSNAVLSFSIAVQRLQAIARRCRQVAQFRGAIQLSQLSAGNMFDRLKTSARLAMMQPLSVRAAERPDHNSILFCSTFNVKQ